MESHQGRQDPLCLYLFEMRTQEQIHDDDLLSDLWKEDEARMNDIAIKILILLIGSMLGFGLGFIFACFGASGIVREKNQLKDELEKVTAERDELKKKGVVKVEIHDPTVGRNVKFGGF